MFLGPKKIPVLMSGGRVEPPATMAPAAPSGLTVTALSPTSVRLRWTDNGYGEDGEDLFRIHFCAGAACGFGIIVDNTVGKNVKTIVITNLSENGVYSFRVRAENTFGNSAWVDNIDFLMPLYNPTNIVVTNPTDTSADVAWTDNSGQEEGYEIEWSTDDFVSLAGSDTLAADSNSYTIATLSEGTLYSVRVRAFNITTSNMSDNVQSTAFYSLLSAPTLVSLSNATATTIDVDWDDVSALETTYELAYSDDGFFTQTVIQFPADTISTTLTGLTPSTTYDVKVGCFENVPPSRSSLYTSAAPLATLPDVTVPAAPTGLAISALQPTTLTLTWTDNSGPGTDQEDNFEIYRCTGSACDFSVFDNYLLAADVVTLNFSGQTENTLYSYRVRATNLAGSSSWNTVADTLTPLLAPTGVADTDITHNTITIGWTDNSSANDGYEIEWSTDDFGTIAGSATVGDVATYQATSLSESTGYKFRVRATLASPANTSDWNTSATINTEAFAPTQYANLLLWCDSSDLFSMTLNGSNQCSQWNDKSGNNYHLVQGTLTRQPVYQATLGTGLNFSANKVFETPSNAVFNMRTYTVGFVITPTGASGNLMNDSGGSGFYANQLAATRRRNFGYRNGSNVVTNACNNATTEMNVNQTYYVDFQITNTLPSTTVTSSSKLNDAAEITGSQATGMNVTATNKLIIGAGTSLGGGNLAGQIKEVVIYTRELTPTERTRLWQYFDAKWSIP